MIECNTCNLPVVQCKCRDIDSRLRTANATLLEPAITNALIEREKRNRTPRNCVKAVCGLQAHWIPVITLTAAVRKGRFLIGNKAKVVSAELLNSPLCDLHKERVTISDFITEETVPYYKKFFAQNGLHDPPFSRIILTFRRVNY